VVSCKVLEVEQTINRGTIEVIKREDILVKFDKFRTHKSMRIESTKTKNVVVIYTEKLKLVDI